MFTMFPTKRNLLYYQLAKAFPKEYSSDVKAVCSAFRSVAPINDHNVFYFDHTTEWQLTSGESITVPYRICVKDELALLCKLTDTQELIYHCVGSRNPNGYVRQKHIEALLSTDLPEWVLPYIIKICDEYIIEILETVYQRLQGRNCEVYKTLCRLNLDYIKLGHSRMISYWNEFYRWDCYRYNDYIGKKLYSECFGYRKTGQKTIQF